MTTSSKNLIFLRRLFYHAIESTHPKIHLPRFLPPRPQGRLIVCSLGKAAVGMAQAAESFYGPPLDGVVIAPERNPERLAYLTYMPGRHPVPDESSVAAAKVLFNKSQNLTAKDLFLFLLSGGGSALACMPARGITLEEKQLITKTLLRSGAPISEMNCVRRHLSDIKGGKLANTNARCLTLAVSDVPGNNPLTIASGPTVSDPTTPDEALAICRNYGISLPDSVASHLQIPQKPQIGGDNTFVMIAKPADLLIKAEQMAESEGYRVISLGADIEGEAAEVGKQHGEIALHHARLRQPGDKALVILSGGETTVTVRGTGNGGRNTEYLLSLALHLQAAPDVYALAADTDGIDGRGENAGAVCGPDTLSKLTHHGLNPASLLENNDALTGFSSIGQTLVTGPTGTNLNDFRAIMVG